MAVTPLATMADTHHSNAPQDAADDHEQITETSVAAGKIFPSNLQSPLSSIADPILLTSPLDLAQITTSPPSSHQFRFDRFEILFILIELSTRRDRLDISSSTLPALASSLFQPCPRHSSASSRRHIETR
jgi:hypothetical protein